MWSILLGMAFASTINLSAPVVIVLFGVCVVAVITFVVFSAILTWHWKSYATGKFTTTANLLLYLLVGIALLLTMTISAVSYSLV